MKTIMVNTAEFAAAAPPDILMTLGIGSCVAVCLYDPETKLGGLAHIMLPRNENMDTRRTGKFADTGIAALIQLMSSLGACSDRLVAKIAGGARVIAAKPAFLIGERNVKAVKETLASHRIRIAAEHTGGVWGRAAAFNTKTGMVEVTVLTQNTVIVL